MNQAGAQAFPDHKLESLQRSFESAIRLDHLVCTCRFSGIGPAEVDPANIHSVNRYAYANNNPYKYIDPDARVPVPLILCAANPSGCLLAGVTVVAVATTVPTAIVNTWDALSPRVRNWIYSDNANQSNDAASGNTGGAESQQAQPEKKIPKPGVSGKEGAKDAPSWARGERPNVNESGKDFADRLLNDKYGEDSKRDKGQGSEHSRIKKWGDRAFINPPSQGVSND